MRRLLLSCRIGVLRLEALALLFTADLLTVSLNCVFIVSKGLDASFLLKITAACILVNEPNFIDADVPRSSRDLTSI